MIKAGQFIKVIFKNSTQVEGKVESWSEKESILVALDGQSRFVIFDTSNDVLGVKITYNESVKKPTEEFKQTLEKFEEVKSIPSEDPLRHKKISELKILMNEQEKKIISEKLQEHTISDLRTTNYGFPNIKKQSVK